AADGALFRHHLVRLFDDPQDREPPLPGRLLKADERVVHFLLGVEKIDGRLLPFTDRLDPARRPDELALPPGLAGQLTRAAELLREGGGILCLQGPAGVGKRAAAEAVCAQLGRPLLAADLAQALTQDLPPATTAALWRREAALSQSALYLSHFEI